MEKSDLIANLESFNGYYNVFSNFEEVIFHREIRKFSEDEESFVEKEWKKLTNEDSSYPHERMIGLYVDKTELDHNTLHVYGYLTDYKHYKTTLDHSTLRVWSAGSAAIARINEDNKLFYIFAERYESKKKGANLLETIPSGFLYPECFEHQELFNLGLLKELIEETGIPAKHVIKTRYLRMGQMRKDPDTKLETACQDAHIDYLIDINGVSIKRAYELFKQREDGEEHSSIHIIPEGELLDYISDNLNNFMPRTRFTLSYFIQNHYNG